jgi:dihydroxy-acid dehydratase
VNEAVLAERRAAREVNGTAVWKPRFRNRNVSPALKAYAAFTTSAARGAVRDVEQYR